MIKEKELVLLKHLRQNSRRSIADLSKETKIPLSTLFDVLRRVESDYVVKYTSLIDFSKIGYGLRVNFIIKSRKKKELNEFLMKNPNVNSLCSLSGDSDLYAECVFKEMKEVIEFRENIQNIGIEKINEIFVVEEVKKEGFVLN
jgi:DNA-binding Lrp family transcriptional regulator